MSFISTDQACRNVNDQIPAGTSLDTLRTKTRDDWTTKVLSKVTTKDTDQTKLQLLYSSLYHMNIIPTNKTGENPKWSSREPYYDDTFTLWDLVRNQCIRPRHPPPRANKLPLVPLHHFTLSYCAACGVRGIY